MCICYTHVCVIQLSVCVESVEVILESEATTRTRSYPILAFNVSVLAQVFEWTGDVSTVQYTLVYTSL